MEFTNDGRHYACTLAPQHGGDIHAAGLFGRTFAFAWSEDPFDYTEGELLHIIRTEMKASGAPSSHRWQRYLGHATRDLLARQERSLQQQILFSQEPAREYRAMLGSLIAEWRRRGLGPTPSELHDAEQRRFVEGLAASESARQNREVAALAEIGQRLGIPDALLFECEISAEEAFVDRDQRELEQIVSALEAELALSWLREVSLEQVVYLLHDLNSLLSKGHESLVRRDIASVISVSRLNPVALEGPDEVRTFMSGRGNALLAAQRGFIASARACIASLQESGLCESNEYREALVTLDGRFADLLAQLEALIPDDLNTPESRLMDALRSAGYADRDFSPDEEDRIVARMQQRVLRQTTP